LKVEVEENRFRKSKKENYSINSRDEEASKAKLQRQHLILDQQERDIQVIFV